MPLVDTEFVRGGCLSAIAVSRAYAAERPPVISRWQRRCPPHQILRQAGVRQQRTAQRVMHVVELLDAAYKNR